MRFCFFFLLLLASSLSAMGPLTVVGVRAALCMQDKKKSLALRSASSKECIACASVQEEQGKQLKSLLRRDSKSYDLKGDSEGAESLKVLRPSISPDTSTESISSVGSAFERDYPFSAHGIAKPINTIDEDNTLINSDFSDIFRGWAWAYDEPDDSQSLADTVCRAAVQRARRNTH
ncbi:hypothetical protein CVU75_02915 [Candidatus Dependentiae bacterium HGW-Dependentiae-1]|nr:MAG: hypothetical protein CVU75_02915 [Candidatus Dependentiae bacterium HGW-Dependentiae-1]